MKRLRIAGSIPLAVLLLISAVGGATGQTREKAREDYKLGPEDVIRIQAWGRADLATEAALDETGRVALPLVGVIEAGGLSPEQLATLLTDRYQLLDPRVTEILITVVQYNSRSVTVVGEVRNPGRFGFQTIPDLWKVLLTAGGPTPEADLTNVQVVRDRPSEGEPRIVTINLSKGIERTNPDLLPVLGPKDTIILPSLAEVASPSDKFQVLGAVRSPGSYRIQLAASVIEAISAAGGELPDADLSKARLTRTTPLGTVSYTLDLESYLEEGTSAVNLELRPGDTISLPRKASAGQRALEGLSRVAPVLSLATSIVSLIVAAR
ncbi:MAG: SLBB domain-containing protein [Candidatus Eisenbacteria bacterium]